MFRKDGRIKWNRLWAIAHFDLHLTREQFWKLTWFQFNCLLDRYINEQEQQDWRAALVAHVLANIHRKDDSKTFTVEDFMPQRRGGGPAKKKDGMTADQMLAVARTITAAFGGKDKRSKKKE